MAESTSYLIAKALERALGAPDGLPLLAGKQAEGLFPSVAGGKTAAQEAQASGLVRVLRTESKGKATTEICTLTEKGLAYLLEQSSPRPVLESLLKAIDACQAKVDTWVASVQDNRQSLGSLREMAERVLQQMQKPQVTMPSWAKNGHSHDPQARIVELLRGWQASADYPLPDLFDRVRETSPKTTIGQFHDALRTLHEQRIVYLHPWTGPLSELPRPAASLLVGHEIAYYASLRSVVGQVS